MAERRLHGLQRVLGVNALFSTAYGNVGLVDLLRARPRRVVRARPHAGGVRHHRRHLLPDRRHLRRGDGDVPGGRRLVELRAPRLQRVLVLLRRLGARCSTTRSRSPSRRSSCRTTSAGCSGSRCATRPGDIIFGIARRRRASRRQRRRRQGVGGLNIVLAVIDFLTQLLLVLVGVVLVLSPETLVDNVDLGVAPTWKDFLLAIPVGDDRLHRHRDDLEHGRGGQGRAQDDPGGDQAACVIAVFAIYAPLPAVALSALPVFQRRGRQVRHAAGPARGGGRLRRRPDPRRRQAASTSASFQDAGEIYVGLLAATILFIATNAGHHRRLAARLLDGPAPPGARPAAPAAPAATARRGSGSSSSAPIACLAMIPGQADFLGNMYAFGAMLSFTIAHLAVDPPARHPAATSSGPYRGPGNAARRAAASCRCSRSSAGSARAWRSSS